MSEAAAPCISIVVPVFNEAENIGPYLTDLEAALAEPHETLIVYDFPEDTTLKAIGDMHPAAPNVRLVHNPLGRGVLNA
ncbi:MAG: glycosyltransferase, partial [Gemmataceae bacterium]